MRAAKIRSGFEQTSTDMGVANVGDIIDEIESRVNARGVTRTPRMIVLALSSLEFILLRHIRWELMIVVRLNQVCTTTAAG
eukprot:COSAG04_NODE_808_length_10146_cov_19.381905_2_plen_81_part_00